MSEFWNNLSERERRLIQLAALIMGVCLFYLLIANPVMTWRGGAHDRKLHAHQQYQLVQEAAAYSPGGAQQRVDRSTPLRKAVIDSAKNHQVNLTYIGELNGNDLSINAASAVPQSVFMWITALEQGYGVRVKKADIARETSDPDKIRVQIVFGRG